MGNDIAIYDYCAFVLLLVIGVYYLRTSVRGTYRAYIMTAIVAITMAAAAFDATAVRFAGLDPVSSFRFLNVNLLYLLLFALISPLFLLYTVATTDMWHSLRRLKVLSFLCLVPLAATLCVRGRELVRKVEKDREKEKEKNNRGQTGKTQNRLRGKKGGK